MNRGILEAVASRVVTSVSVLVNAPGWEDGLDRLGAWPELGIGLHLNLTAGRPLTDGATLRDPATGAFHPLRALVIRALRGRIDSAEVQAECAAQLTRLRETGAPLTHLDSHRHVHALPGVWRPVVETARREGIGVVRVPLEPGTPSLKGLALRAAWRVAARGVPVPRHPQRFYGISLQARPDFAQRLLRLLDRLPRGTTELMVHPGHPDAALAAWDDYTAPRAVELAALTGEAIRSRLSRGDLRLATFASLESPTAPPASPPTRRGRESPSRGTG